MCLTLTTTASDLLYCLLPAVRHVYGRVSRRTQTLTSWRVGVATFTTSMLSFSQQNSEGRRPARTCASSALTECPAPLPSKLEMPRSTSLCCSLLSVMVMFMPGGNAAVHCAGDREGRLLRRAMRRLQLWRGAPGDGSPQGRHHHALRRRGTYVPCVPVIAKPY